MKPIAFRVTKYRNIQDSKTVELADSLTCIVGKNQSGKTALLKALHKFNPHNKAEKYNLIRDWPRGERRDRNSKQVVCEIKFELSPQERNELSTLADHAMDATQVVVTKNYDAEFEVSFPSNPSLFPAKLHPNAVDELCATLPSYSEPVGQQFDEAALRCAETFRLWVSEGRYGDLPKLRDQHAEELRRCLSPNNPQPQHQNENGYIQAYNQKVGEIISKIPSIPTMQAKSHEFIVSKLPTFIYMDDYREFQGATILDQLRTRRKSPTPEDETILMTLALAALDLDNLVTQGESSSQEVIRERQYDLDDAAKTLTNAVSGRWGQTPYRVEFRCDGQKFFVEIEETGKNVGMIPLEEQSKGFRWFFSFDLRFMHDSGGTFRDCVLLLDEPGLHLHPGGQADLLKRLDAYSAENVLIYTTHLPFLVDLREPRRIHVIQQEGDHATVTDDLGASGPDEKLTLQAALGMQLNQHYLISERNLIVEGVDDFYIISELSSLFQKAGRPALPENVEITAAGGAPEAVYMATFMVGQKLGVVTLFDSDHEGRTQEEKLRTKWITRYKDSRSSTLLLGDAVRQPGDFAIEDMFPEDFYLRLAEASHKEKLKAVHHDGIPLVGTGLLCDRVERGCTQVGIKFNKGSVAKAVRRELSKMSDITTLDQTLVAKTERLFAALDAKFNRLSRQ